MSRLLLTSDLHLGHKNIAKYRTQFSSAEEHDEIVWDNLASTVTKRDTIYFLGDIAFTKYWLDKIEGLKARHKMLIVGNHDTERGVKMGHIVNAYDSVEALLSKRNKWFSHAPVHPQEIRDRDYNIHGHIHGFENQLNDPRYFNVNTEFHGFMPITFQEIEEIQRSRQ